jgi:hypothetical protein
MQSQSVMPREGGASSNPGAAGETPSLTETPGVPDRPLSRAMTPRAGAIRTEMTYPLSWRART